jgi:hypothetical protein
MNQPEREAPTQPVEQPEPATDALAEQPEPATDALAEQPEAPAEMPLAEQVPERGGIIGIVRSVTGWICIVAGLMTVCLPIPIGLPLIALGVFLIGPDSPVGRRVMHLVKKGLRREE